MEAHQTVNKLESENRKHRGDSKKRTCYWEDGRTVFEKENRKIER